MNPGRPAALVQRPVIAEEAGIWKRRMRTRTSAGAQAGTGILAADRLATDDETKHPKPCQSHPNAVYKGYTRDAHWMYTS